MSRERGALPDSSPVREAGIPPAVLPPLGRPCAGWARPGAGEGGVRLPPARGGAGMVTPKGTPAPAPRDPVAEPGLAEKLTRKKKKKRFWKNKARGASRKPGGDPAVALRPPRAPEAFSQNWKALQEVRGRLRPSPQVGDQGAAWGLGAGSFAGRAACWEGANSEASKQRERGERGPAGRGF